MSQTIAILTSEETVPTGLSAAFSSQTAEVVHIPCNEYLPVAIQAAEPSFAVIANDKAWGGAGSVRELLEMMGIAVLGPTAATVRQLSNLADTYAAIEAAVGRGEIDACLPDHVYLSTGVASALVQLGKLDLLEQRFEGGYPLVVRDAFCSSAQRPLYVRDTEELARALTSMAAEMRDVVICAPFEGVEVVVPVLGDLDDILVLPPIELDGSGMPGHVPVRLASLASEESDAQGVRSEIERCALDAFIVCGCREAATIHLGWDGGKPCFLGIDSQPSLLEDGLIGLSLSKAGIDPHEVAVELSEILFERS